MAYGEIFCSEFDEDKSSLFTAVNLLTSEESLALAVLSKLSLLSADSNRDA